MLHCHWWQKKKSWRNDFEFSFDWLSVIYFHPVKNFLIINGNEANWDLTRRCENRMRTVERQREQVGGLAGEKREVEERLCRRGGGWVIRWVSANSTILHLDSGGGCHEMCWFISLFCASLPVSAKSFYQNKSRQKNRFRVTRRLRLPERRGRKVTWNRRLHWDHRPQENVSMNWCTEANRDIKEKKMKKSIKVQRKKNWKVEVEKKLNISNVSLF